MAYLNHQEISAGLRRPADFDFVAQGARNSASPVSICSDKINLATEAHPVIVMPGFSAIDESGSCVLLGRGGSDISAVFLAHGLKLPGIRLIKDVDGLYDYDPNKYARARRYQQVNYATALQIGGELVQPEAIALAAEKNICIDIAAMGKSYVTSIGTMKNQFEPDTFSQGEGIDEVDSESQILRAAQSC